MTGAGKKRSVDTAFSIEPIGSIVVLGLGPVAARPVVAAADASDSCPIALRRRRPPLFAIFITTIRTTLELN